VDGATVADGAMVVGGAWDSDLAMDIRTTVVITAVILDTRIIAVIDTLTAVIMPQALQDEQGVTQDEQDAIEMKRALKDVAQKK